MTTKLDFIILPTYNTLLLGIKDCSIYDNNMIVTAPSIEITVPGFNSIMLPFNINDINVFSSSMLGLTPLGEPITSLPDGIYCIKYTIFPAFENFVEHSIMRTDKIQEKFDEAFMRMSFMECDKVIKKQQKDELDSIYIFIQGSIAAANNCATDDAIRLYNKAEKMLNNFNKNNCKC